MTTTNLLKLSFALIALIALLIIGPVITIILMNFLLAQMFTQFIPLQINIWNWLVVAILESNGLIRSVKWDLRWNKIKEHLK